MSEVLSRTERQSRPGTDRVGSGRRRSAGAVVLARARRSNKRGPDSMAEAEHRTSGILGIPHSNLRIQKCDFDALAAIAFGTTPPILARRAVLSHRPILLFYRHKLPLLAGSG